MVLKTENRKYIQTDTNITSKWCAQSNSQRVWECIHIKALINTFYSSEGKFSDLISESLTDLSCSKGKLAAIIIVQVLKIYKYSLSCFRAHIPASDEQKKLACLC